MDGRPTRRRPWRRWLAPGLVLAVACVLVVVTATPSAQSPEGPVAMTHTATPTLTTPQASPSAPPPAAPPPRPYPGAAFLVEGGELPDVPYRPTPGTAWRDRPVTYENGCHVGEFGTTPRICEYGPPDAEHTIALVGDSHSAHWLPALQAVTYQLNWRILSITKSSCRLGIYGTDTPNHASCREWNAAVLERLRTLRPELVLTRATEGSGHSDYMLAGSTFPQWRALEEMGIPIIALRDNPWYSFDVSECVGAYGPTAQRCGSDRAQRGLLRPMVVPDGYTLPTNVQLLDMTDYFCEATFCPAVIGNILVVRDKHHFTASYSATMGPYLAEKILELTGWQQPVGHVEGGFFPGIDSRPGMNA